MRGTIERPLLCVIVALAGFGISSVVLNATQEKAGKRQLTFDERLESKVAQYDTGGRPFVGAVLDLVCRYQLPLGLEYVDREAVRKPLNLKLTNKPVREILQALVAQVPQYRLRISPDVIEVYSPKARADASNFLNTVVANFARTGQTPRMVSLAIYSAVTAERHQVCCGIVNVLEPGDAPTVTLALRDKRAYELLDALVARMQGFWIPVVPPEKLSVPGPKLWEVYQLEYGPNLAMADLERAFPPEK